MVTEGAQHCTQVWQNFGAGGQNKYPDSLRYNYKSIKTACCSSCSSCCDTAAGWCSGCAYVFAKQKAYAATPGVIACTTQLCNPPCLTRICECMQLLAGRHGASDPAPTAPGVQVSRRAPHQNRRQEAPQAWPLAQGSAATQQRGAWCRRQRQPRERPAALAAGRVLRPSQRRRVPKRR